MPKNEEYPDPSEETTADAGDVLGSMDFNVDDEYKPNPLIPAGTYHAAVTKVALAPAQFAIVWDLCLHDNGGVMNDGETPLDGGHVFFRNWLPKPGDESTPTKDGKSNKRQSKINQLKDFMEAMGVNMSTPQMLAEALAEGQWIGLEADVDVTIEEYQGRFRNSVGRIRKSTI
jgi:hypothetical protein